MGRLEFLTEIAQSGELEDRADRAPADGLPRVENMDKGSKSWEQGYSPCTGALRLPRVENIDQVFEIGWEGSNF